MGNLKLLYYLGGLDSIKRLMIENINLFLCLQIWLKANLNSLLNQILVIKIYETKKLSHKKAVLRQLTKYPKQVCEIINFYLDHYCLLYCKWTTVYIQIKICKILQSFSKIRIGSTITARMISPFIFSKYWSKTYQWECADCHRLTWYHIRKVLGVFHDGDKRPGH